MKASVGIFLILMLITIGYQQNKIDKLKTENDRIENNFLNANQKLDSVKNRNGNYHYTVEALELTKKELQKTNSDLVDQLDQMKLKLKNLESITKTEVKYVVKDSVVYVDKYTDSTYFAKREDNWIKNTWKSTVTRDGNLLISDYQLEVRDSILMPVEIEYKGWWIFRKPKGVRVHIQSVNPHSRFEKVEYIKLSKKK